MQDRQNDRTRYFNELAQTSEKYFLPYIASFKKPYNGMRILEIGCGDGGNLLPFARRGCKVVGVDLSPSRIAVARQQFKAEKAEGEFIASDIFKITELEHQFELIICHDVLEHIDDKFLFMQNIRRYLAPEGILFMSFPAWQMPFGGHQQICHNRLLSHLPFFHLLPCTLYKAVLKAGNETTATINELMSIKRTRCSIECFERVRKQTHFEIIHRLFYFINPHYEVKFHLRPRKLWGWLGYIPVARNFFTTSSFYVLKPTV